MTPTELRGILLEVLQEIAPDAETDSMEEDLSFHEQFDLDSVDFLRLMIALEKRLEVHINELDYPRLSTPRGCRTYLEKLLGLLPSGT
jgi:acyl carrier protein